MESQDRRSSLLAPLSRSIHKIAAGKIYPRIKQLAVMELHRNYFWPIEVDWRSTTVCRVWGWAWNDALGRQNQNGILTGDSPPATAMPGATDQRLNCSRQCFLYCFNRFRIQKSGHSAPCVPATNASMCWTR